MNAYELADELQELDAKLHLIVLFKSAEMLRQQADRIAELEKDGKVCATCGGLVYDPVIKQTKPLSEKELYEVFDKCYPNNGDGDVVTLVDFARAIEERHGIK